MPLWQRILIGPVKFKWKIEFNWNCSHVSFSRWTDKIPDFRRRHSSCLAGLKMSSVLSQKPGLTLHGYKWPTSDYCKKCTQSDQIQCAFISQNMSDVILLSATVSLVYRGRSISTISICWDWESFIVENAERKGWQPNCVHTCRLFQA